jgi:hypothetical protein
MFVRIARFEGGTTPEIEAEGERIQRDLSGTGGGHTPSEIPPELTRLTRRLEMLVDRERGSVALLVYAQTQDQIREIDRIMDDMSPTSSGWGKRVSVETYEVFLDESPELAQAA